MDMRAPILDPGRKYHRGVMIFRDGDRRREARASVLGGGAHVLQAHDSPSLRDSRRGVGAAAQRAWQAPRRVTCTSTIQAVHDTFVIPPATVAQVTRPHCSLADRE